MPWKDKPFGWGKALAGEALFSPIQGATVAVLEQVKDLVASDATINEIVFNVDVAEPPSVELAIQLMLDQANSKLKFECVSESKLSPDPKSSNSKQALWKFSQGKPAAAVPNPDAKFKTLCTRIVTASSDCAHSWKLAKASAKFLSAENIDAILSVMVHPPAVESGFTSSEWVRQIQLAAAQMASCVEQGAQIPLAESKVADLTRGPMDWTVDSAMVAVAQRAKEEVSLNEEACDLVQSVLLRVPDKGTWSCRDVGKSVLRFLATERPLNVSTIEPTSSNQ